MSQVSTQHSILPFVKGESKALGNQRLLRALAHKGTKINKCTSVPHLEASCTNDPRFQAHFLEYLESTRQEMFKLVVHAAPNRTSISDQELSADAIYAFLESQAAGERLSAESIKRWFAAMAQDSLLAACAQRMGIDLEDEVTPAQEATLIGTVAALQAIMELLATKNLTLGEKQKKAIQFVLDSLPPVAADSPLTGKIEERFAAVCAPRENAEDLLGFLSIQSN